MNNDKMTYTQMANAVASFNTYIGKFNPDIQDKLKEYLLNRFKLDQFLTETKKR